MVVHATPQTIRQTIGKLKRWTPLTYLRPAAYISRGPFWETFDLESWSRFRYHWDSDPWNGYKDFAQRPETTVSDGRGDCEDYALVAASWAIAQGRGPVRLGFCWEKGNLHPTHAVCDDGQRIYSSGELYDDRPDEYLEWAPYDHILWRTV